MKDEDKIRMNSRIIRIELERFDETLDEMKRCLDGDTLYPLYQEISSYFIAFGEGFEKYRKEVYDCISAAQPSHLEDYESIGKG